MRSHDPFCRLCPLLIAAFLLVGCLPGATSLPPTLDPSAPQPSPSRTPTATATQVPPIQIDNAALRGLRIQVWHAFTGEAYQVFSDQVELFNAVNEWGLEVSEHGYGDYTTLREAVETAGLSESLPGLVAAQPEQLLDWDELGRVVDLNRYATDPHWGLDEQALEDIPPVFRSQDLTQGRQLGLPALRSAVFLFYNQSWGRELGFSQPPANPQEFRQQVCAANADFRTDASMQNDGLGGWIVDPRWQTSYSWLLAFGGGVQDGSEYRFRSQQNLAALAFLKGLYDDNCAWLSTADAPYDAFALRQALVISADLAEVPLVAAAVQRAGNSDEWTLLPFPGSEQPVLVTYGPSFAVLDASPEANLAGWLFTRWLLSAENQALWVEATGMLPLRSSLIPMISPFRQASPQWEAARAALPLAAGVPQQASWNQVRFVLEDGATVLYRMDTAIELIPGLLAEMDLLAEELTR